MGKQGIFHLNSPTGQKLLTVCCSVQSEFSGTISEVSVETAMGPRHSMADACNPSYVGGTDLENHGSRLACAKKLVKPHLEQ
jgi:hypothetical protein